MKTVKTISDSRINRDHNAAGYLNLCSELVAGLGYERSFKNASWQMNWCEFRATAYRRNAGDVQLSVVLDFSFQEATITVDEVMTLDDEMKVWAARANDEFGTLLKEIEKQAFGEWLKEEDEYGIKHTPISYYVTAYALDGDRKSTARIIKSYINKYDLMDSDVKKLVDKMTKVAAK